MADGLKGSSVMLQSSAELRPSIEAGLRRAGVRLSSDGLAVMAEKSETPSGPVLTMRMQTGDRIVLFVEACQETRSVEAILSARPLMTYPRPVLDVKNIGEFWLVLEPDRLLMLDGPSAQAVVKETRPVSAAVRRDPRGYILPGAPVTIRMEEPGPVSVADCDGKEQSLTTSIQKDGEVTIGMAGARPLSLPGILTAINQFSPHEVTVVLRQPREEAYTIWLVSVSCVR